MGGAAEQTANQTERKPTGEEIVVGRVRFHESAGKVHFHDDINKLKVEVPVADWWENWSRLKSGRTKRIKMIDTDRKTQVSVRLSGKGGAVNAQIRVTAVNVSPDFEALNKFSTAIS